MEIPLTPSIQYASILVETQSNSLFSVPGMTENENTIDNEVEILKSGNHAGPWDLVVWGVPQEYI